MKYAQVENGEIVKLSSKPTSARTSNLWLNPEALAEEKWLPVDDQKPSLQPWQKRGARSEEVQADKVVFSYEVIDTSLDDYKTEKLKNLGTSSTNVILSKAPEYKQRNAALGVYDQAKIDEITGFITTVRTEHNSKEAAILAASTYGEVDAVYTGIIAYLDPSTIDENGFPIPEDI